MTESMLNETICKGCLGRLGAKKGQTKELRQYIAILALGMVCPVEQASWERRTGERYLRQTAGYC